MWSVLPCKNFPTIPKVFRVTQTLIVTVVTVLYSRTQCEIGQVFQDLWRLCVSLCVVFLFGSGELMITTVLSGLWLVGSMFLHSISQRLLNQRSSFIPPIFHHFGLDKCVEYFNSLNWANTLCADVFLKHKFLKTFKYINYIL